MTHIQTTMDPGATYEQMNRAPYPIAAPGAPVEPIAGLFHEDRYPTAGIGGAVEGFRDLYAGGAAGQPDHTKYIKMPPGAVAVMREGSDFGASFRGLVRARDNEVLSVVSATDYEDGRTRKVVQRLGGFMMNEDLTEVSRRVEALAEVVTIPAGRLATAAARMVGRQARTRVRVRVWNADQLVVKSVPVDERMDAAA